MFLMVKAAITSSLMVVIWLNFGCIASDFQGAGSINCCEKMGDGFIASVYRQLEARGPNKALELTRKIAGFFRQLTASVRRQKGFGNLQSHVKCVTLSDR
jgi:hypothetical protein